MKFPRKLADMDMEAEQMRQVQLLLQNLTNREEATIKLIFDRLYDVGSVNLVDQKFRYRVINRIMKYITQMSKPVFRIFAWYWFKQNSTYLITNWLYAKITFGNPRNRLEKQSSQKTTIQPYYPKQPDNFAQEIKYLRRQVKLITGLFIITLSTLVIVVVGLNIIPLAPLHSSEQIK